MIRAGLMQVIAASATSSWNPGKEAGLVSWFDMSDPDSYDTTAKIWTPRYGSKTLAAPSAGPAKIATGFGGSTDALQFTGTSDTSLVLDNPGIAEFISVFVVQVSGFVQPPMLMRRPDYGSVTQAISFDYGGGVRSQYLGGEIDYYDNDMETPNMLVLLHSKAARTIRVWGEQVATNTTVTTGTDIASADMHVGWYEGAARAWTFHLAAFATFAASAWSDALAEKIEGFIAHQGLGTLSTTNLPLAHPYKVNAPT